MRQKGPPKTIEITENDYSKRKIVNSVATVLLLSLVVLGYFVFLPWWGYTVVFFIWFLILLCGSFFIQWDFHLKSLHSNKLIEENWVSISFDDGPNPEFTIKALKLLRKYDAKATFFCIGQNINENPEIVQQIVAEGHSLGNHTYSHSKSFGFFGLEEVKTELQKTNSLVKKLTGLSLKLYRPAFGVTNPAIETAVFDLQIQSIGWSVRSLDTTKRSEDSVLKRITSKTKKGDIILLHDTSAKSIAVLERLLVFLQEKNLQSVTVNQLLEIKAYG